MPPELLRSPTIYLNVDYCRGESIFHYTSQHAAGKDSFSWAEKRSNTLEEEQITDVRHPLIESFYHSNFLQMPCCDCVVNVQLFGNFSCECSSDDTYHCLQLIGVNPSIADRIQIFETEDFSSEFLEPSKRGPLSRAICHSR